MSMSCCPNCNLKYTGSTPGADANTYSLINSYTAGWPGHFASMTGTNKLALTLDNDQLGTLKFYVSSDGVTWTQNGGDIAVPIPAAGSTNDYEFLVETAPHFKLEFTNGGVGQTTWVVLMTLIDERAKA